VIDSLKLIPFLFLTYLAMEYLEHRTGDGARRLIGKFGNRRQDEKGRRQAGLGPVVGALLGVVPQCGFSAAASNLYAGRVITLGTLIAVYLSTSDEMLPILLSQRSPAGMILGILSAKVVIGMAAGLGIDLLLGRRGAAEKHRIHEICEQEGCHCERGIFLSAVSHTLKIAFFILVVNLLLNMVLEFVGEDVLAGLILNRPVLGSLLAGLVGLIPNCAASVVLTQLYLEGAMSMGAVLAGLLANSGVGVLVLMRVNRDRRENLKILGLLYAVGTVAGIAVDLFGMLG